MLTILAVSDSGYIPFVRVLFNSIKANVKIPYKLHLHAINVEEKKLDDLENNYKNISFSRDNIILDDTPTKKNAFGKSLKAAYCANIRAKVLHDLLQDNQYVLYLDADSIVRKDLEGILYLIKQNDLMIFRRDHSHDPKTKVLTSVIGINKNRNSLAFIESWKGYMMQDKVLYRWFGDQLYFYKTMEKAPHVQVGCLPTSYVDSSFTPSAFIWNGKAARKYRDIKYRKEMERYK